MIDSVEIQTVDLARARHLQPPLSAALLDHLAQEEDLCSMMRYHLKSFSIGSLAVGAWEVLSVGYNISSLSTTRSLQLVGGGMFNTGPQFVFNMGGGPGFRVHQFGGGAPRRRPRETNGQNADRPQGPLAAISNLLPLLVLFILPLLSSLFSSIPSGPSIHFQEGPPNTLERITPRHSIHYWINPDDVADYTTRKLKELDRTAENQYITNVRYECDIEIRTRNRMVEGAQGWFFVDERKIKEARNYQMKACRRLDSFGLGSGI